MKNKRWIIAAFILACTLIFGSCSNYVNSSDDFYGGDIIDSEMLSSIAESVFASDESLRPDQTEIHDESEKENDSTNFGDDNVTDEPSSSDSEGESDENTSTDNDQQEETTKRVHDGVFYWTESGKVYHKWADCGYLKNSDNVLSGNAQDVEAAGKEKLCSSCEKK